MLLVTGNNITIRIRVFGFIYAATLLGYSTGTKYEFDDCRTHDNATGICRAYSECQPLKDKIISGTISVNDAIHCGFTVKEEIICCPTEIEIFQAAYGFPVTARPKSARSTTTSKNTLTNKLSQVNANRIGRPAEEACRIIIQGLSNTAIPHILGGMEVEAGYYPHMAAIGYTAIDNVDGPYRFDCGGTLIHERFILTAAHCVSNPSPVPVIVRLGMSNFDDDGEIVNRLEVPIKTLHIHPNYSWSKKINDVALLEFEKPVNKTRFISPTCLYTKNVDPPQEAELYVAGWGVYNYTTKKTSKALLKTRMKILSNSMCKDSFKDLGFTPDDAHMCATDPQNTNDACMGDSGGPLLLHVDESTLNYRQVGIISSGNGCAGTLPSLYMRVSSYLDYIESIVWPSN